MNERFKVLLDWKHAEYAVFSPQASLYKTIRGKELPQPLTKEAVALYYQPSLCGHAWLDNPFVNAVLMALDGRPQYVTWVGRETTGKEYDMAWGANKLEVSAFPVNPPESAGGFLMNHTKRQFLNFGNVRNAYLAVKKHPLLPNPFPLLCVNTNAEDCGYKGEHKDLVGIWTGDCLEYSEKIPFEVTNGQYKEFLPVFDV